MGTVGDPGDVPRMHAATLFTKFVHFIEIHDILISVTLVWNLWSESRTRAERGWSASRWYPFLVRDVLDVVLSLPIVNEITNLF